jgi:gliding motility-associated protein GldM
MAGGKETPRQKMIGMMYLVLTALLALNVSNAVLEKFAIIDDTLSGFVKEASTTNDRKKEGILAAASTDAKVVDAKEKAKQVRDLTKGAIDYLDKLKKQMETEPDGKAIERAELVTNTNRAEELMLDHRKPEVGIGYEKQLRSYVDGLNKLMGGKPQFPKLTRTAIDYEEFKNSTHKDKPFLEFAFEGVPTMAAIATVSETQSEILKYEATALDALNAIAEGVVYKVDQLVPMVQADANTLVAGQTYEGNLFVAGAASGVNPEMFKDGRPVMVEDVDFSGLKIKAGKIKFIASASNFDASGIAKTSYNVEIRLPNRPPLKKSIEYKVIRPVAKFESVAASTLYLDCGNEMSVSIAGLTDVSGLNLSAAADEGVIQKTAPGKFVLVPKRPQMNVNITMNGGSIGIQKFTAKGVPQPQGILKIGNAEYDPARGIPPGNSIVKYVPEISDELFLKQNQKDAGYRIVSMSLQMTGKTPITLTSGTIELAKYGLRPGDTFSLSNVQVVRSTWDPNDADNKPVNAKMGGTFKMGTK